MTKKCTAACGKKLSISEFYNDQTRGKTCFNNEEDWLVALKEENPKAYRHLQKDFKRHTDSGEPPAKFCVVSWKKRLLARSGARAAGRSKWMWEREYIEFQGETAQGNVTREEALIMWAALRNNPKTRRDSKGPRGMMRMLVPIGDYESDFDELAEEDEVEAIVSTKKGGTREDVAAMAGHALAGSSSSIFAAEDP